MTDREKRLLFLLLGALFVVVNLGVYAKVYTPRLQEAEGRLQAANARVAEAQINLETRGVYEDDMAWIAKHEPDPTTEQRARTQLQQIAANYARSSGLALEDQRLQETVEDPALNYHRVRIRVLLKGKEQSLYSYLVRMHSPRDFRAVTSLRVNPQKNNPHEVDAEAIIEQWYVPGTGAQGT